MVFRFYFRCSKCGAEMSMKTDPKNSDYIMEQGATRNHEPWREKDRVRGTCPPLPVLAWQPALMGNGTSPRYRRNLHATVLHLRASCTIS